MKKTPILLLIMLTSVTFGAGASSTTQQVIPLPAGVSVHQLDNGLEVVLIENKALPMTGVNVAVKVGSAYENFSTSGMSHMLEHLLFNGTTSRTQKQLYEDVDKIGAYNNANTGYFSTNYMMVTPADKIEQGMELQADMLFNSIMPAEKYEKEKGIVLEEIAISINKAPSQLERNLLSVLYPGHALSLPTLGTYETIKTNELETVVAYYENFYVPNNMILSIVGNFDSAEMLKLAEQYYGKAKPGKVMYEDNENWRTGMQSLRSGIAPAPLNNRFYGGDKTRLQLIYKLDGKLSGDYFSVLTEAAKPVQDKLREELDGKFPKAVRTVVISALPSPVQSYLKVDVTLEDDTRLEDIGAWLQDQLSRSRFKITGKEAAALATRNRLGFLLNIEKPHMFGIMNSQTFATSGIDDVLEEFHQKDLTAEVAAVNATRLDHPVVVVQQPNPAPAHSGQQEASGTTLHQNPDTGLSLTVKQTPDGKLLALHVLVKHKSALESRYGKDIAWVLHDMLGTQLKEFFSQEPASRYGVKIKANDYAFLPMDDIYMHRDFGYIRAEAIAIDVPDALQLLVSQIQDFKPTKAAFEKSMQALKRSKFSMGGEKAQALFTSTYKEQVYAPRTYEISEQAPTFEALQEFGARYLAAENIIYSVVSPQSADEVIRVFDETIQSDSAPSSESFLVDDLQLNSIDAPVSLSLEGGGKQSYLFWGYTKDLEPDDVAPLQVLSLMMRDQIVFDVREKQGLAYRMSVGMEIHGNRVMAYLNMGTRPENIEILLPQMEKLFSADYLNNTDQDNLDRLINKHLGRMAFQRLSSANQGYYAAHSLYFYGDINYDSDLLVKLAAVTVDDIQRVARKYLQPENTWQIVVR